ncbi:MAG: hypothetical protein KatS3mg052_1466 [Candidatus Roseilinea sp.]|nr:MAG: hypothetical protein KatS3mg052_1466 [Candidatus Roseilinea sp.]
MFTYLDATYAKLRYEEMLKEAEEHRLIARATAQNPGALQRARAALARVFAPNRASAESAPAPAMRKGLAAE